MPLSILRSIFSLVIVCLFTAACTTTHTLPQPLRATAWDLPVIWGIDVSGNADVAVIGRQTQQRIEILASPQTAAAVKVAVVNHILKIDAGQTPVSIRITLSQPITRISLHGEARLSATQISDPNLSIYIKDNASINLAGKNIYLRSLQDESTGVSKLEGINSATVILRNGGTGKVSLSGKTNTLDVQLGGAAFLDARRLQAKKAFIRTEGQAAAYINVTNTLYGFAYNDSEIYYAFPPAQLRPDTHISGNVLKIVY